MNNNILVVIVVSVALLSASFLMGDPPPSWPLNYPTWWWDPGVPSSEQERLTEEVIDHTKLGSPGNTTLLNQGQLLWMANQAIFELDFYLRDAGGAGFSLDSLRLPGVDAAHHASVNIGQLKNVSSRFFERFAQVGFKPGDAGWPPGLVLQSTGYPWAANRTPENYSPAVIGQAKNLFSWSIRQWATNDVDADGLPDYWEYYYFGDLASANPNATDLDSDGLTGDTDTAFGLNPRNPGDAHQDLDSDGLSNLVEILAGRSIRLNETPNGRSYSYDRAGRLVQIIYPSKQVFVFTHDKAGNITNARHF